MDWIITCFIVAESLLLVYGGQPVYVSNGTHILSYSKDSLEVKAVLGQTGYHIVGLAVELGNDYMFWSDVSNDHYGIYRSDLQGENITRIVKDVGEVYGVSVDWVSHHVYWTDTERKTVEIANYDGSGRQILVSTNLKSPRSIVAAPIFGYLFWADHKSKRIERAWLDGSHRRTVIKSSLYQPNQMAVSQQYRQLYWVDAKAHSIFSCSLSGKNIKKQVNYRKISRGAPGYGLIVYGNTAVVSTWFNTAIYSMLVQTKKPIWQQEVKSLGTRELYNLVSLNPATQPMTFHPCMDEDKAGCSHMCLPTHKTGYNCTCPTYGGLVLADDGKTCQVPNHILLCTFEDSGDVGFIPLNSASKGGITLISKSTNPRAITFDPVDKMVYWTDVVDRAIYRVRFDGTEKQMFLNSSDGLGLIESLAFDSATGLLFFTNVGQSGSPANWWRRVESISVHTRNRRTIVRDVEEPKALVIDAEQRYLYVADGGSAGRVVQVELDGTDPVVLSDALSDTALTVDNPMAIVLSDHVMYLADSSTLNQSRGLKITVYDRQNGNITEEEFFEDVDAQSMTSDEGDLYISDKAGRQLLHYNGSEIQAVLEDVNPPVGIYYVSTTYIKTADHQSACIAFGCSHDCVPLPWKYTDRFRCLCPDELALILDVDGKNCRRANNFLLYADMVTINMLSLDKDTSIQPLTLHNGDIKSNIETLAYDEVKDRLYWSDLASNAIFMTNLHHFEPVLVYKEQGPIDGLVIDSYRQRLYWTSTPEHRDAGFIAGLNIERGLNSYKRLLSNRNKPKAIALHPNGKWLFWVESKDGHLGAEIHSCKTNGNRYREVITEGVYWPNSIAVTEDKLYIGESSGKIMVANLQGENIQVFYSTPSHVFGLTVHKDLLFYSDWQTLSIYMVDMVIKTPVVMVTNLTRPTSVVLRHPGNITEACISDNISPCTDICVPQVRGEYKCICTGNRTLLEDERSCQDEIVPTTQTTTTVTIPTTTTTTTTLSTSTLPVSTFPVLDVSNLSSTAIPSSAEPTTTMPSFNDNQSSSVGMDTKSGKHYPEPKPTMSTKKQSIEAVMTSTVSSAETSYSFDDKYGVENYDLEDGIKVEPIGRPYFENCPVGEAILASVPDTDHVVELPLKPAGYDSKGNSLPLHCNYELTDNGIRVAWEGEEEESHHVVIFRVTDSLQQTAVCEIAVTLQDVDPPIFTYCPSNIKVRTIAESEEVHWSNPDAIDNIAVRIVTGSHAPDSWFPPGENVVNYTAVDTAGNQAYCTFRVTVLQDKMCNLPEISNGGIVCNHGDHEDGNCRIICETGYVVNPITIFRRMFSCKHPDDIDALQKVMTTQKTCLGLLYPSVIQQEYRLLFHGPINKHKTAVVSNLSTTITTHLAQEELCVDEVCKISDLSIPCDLDTDSNHDNESEARCLDEERDEFFITFNVTLRNNTDAENLDVNKILQQIHLELMSLTSLLRIQMEDHQFMAITDSLSATKAKWSCPLGQIYEKGICIACPPGTFHNISLDICQYCSFSFYEDQEAQVTCKPCDIGQTSPDGATSSTQCHTLPSIDEMTLFVIVTTCSFGVVFLCMAITLYLQCQRQQKRHQAAASQKKTRYNMTPNIYVAPPPILKSKLDDNFSHGQRTYSIDQKRPINIYSNPHDYEDVENNRMASPKSVFSNDMFTMSPGQGLQMNRDYSPGEEVPTGTLSRENTFSNATYSPQFGVKRNDRGSLKAVTSSSPRQQRKMSYESTFSNQSPRMIRAHLGTPTSDTPLITQSPLLRMKLAAYNLNQED